MKKRLLHMVGPLIGLLIFTVAISVLHHELKHYHYHEIVNHLKGLPGRQLLLALVLTILGYVVLTGYDFLSFRYIRHPLAYSKIALTSFLGYSLSHNIGFTLFSGAPIRYRLYSGWGLSAVEVTKVIAMNGLTFWVRLLTLGGAPSSQEGSKELLPSKKDFPYCASLLLLRYLHVGLKTSAFLSIKE
jgi:uncharacterized membrane protein YbhN (UPF0104 family)